MARPVSKQSHIHVFAGPGHLKLTNRHFKLNFCAYTIL
jgi:hypothetical protein